ncbi:hypothetical protein J6590_023967 [Homalodisca vitripennis]|nr:hypothetical protein J6590_023967 [Homalodisca vitripennis]
MDIEGAFNRVAYQSMETAMERFRVPPDVVKWIVALLKSRQGGVLSLLLWAMVVDDLLSKAEKTGTSLLCKAERSEIPGFNPG